MSSHVSIIELRRMSAQELLRDIRLKRAEAAKLRIGIENKSEKNHALYRSIRRDLARMCMVLEELQRSRIVAEKVTISSASPDSSSKKSSRKPSQAARKSVQGSRS